MVNKKKVITLVSGGLDSTVMYYLLKHRGFEPVPIYIFHNGKAFKKEFQALKKLNINPKLLDCPMNDVYNESHDLGFKPGRNIIFAAKAGAYAVVNDIDTLAFGCTAEDIYPDNSPKFYDRMANLLTLGMDKPVYILTPLDFMKKVDIIRLGIKLGVSLEDTWSCYENGEKPCENCKACKERIKAFNEVRTST